MSMGLELLKTCARAGTFSVFLCASVQASFAAPPQQAATALTVDQFGQLLRDWQRESDVKTARQIAGVHLTERADAARIARWQASLSGDRSREALTAVADASAFLAPPVSETPSQPQPDAESAKQILTRTWEYVRQTMPRYPDYFADRTTTSFAFTTDAFLHPLDVLGNPRRAPRNQHFMHEVLGPGKSSDSGEPQLYYLGSRTEEVTYRSGMEVTNSPQAVNASRAPSPIQMSTNGEFGSVLGMVLTDFSQDQMVWSHWERGPNGALAVFSYSVPSEKSHYAVTFTGQTTELPAYHGEIAIEPESGVIHHMTLVAITSGVGFFRESSAMIEFAPVQIGGKEYVCPVHSVAMNRYFDTFEYSNTAHTPVPYATILNDVTFTRYHLFRSQSHMVTGATAR